MIERNGSRWVRWIAGFPILILAFVAWTARTGLADDIVITNAQLFVGNDAEIIEGATLVVSGDRIKAVGTSDSVDVEKAVVIDASGKTALPGLIDAHVHLFFDLQDDVYFPTTDAEARSYVDGRLQDKLAAQLEQGFTSVLSPIDFWPQIIEVRERIASGEFKGPRLFVGGGVFVAPGGHYVCRTQPQDRQRWCDDHISLPISTPEQAREGVQRYADSGVDVIVYDSTTNAPEFARDIVHTLVDEARKSQLPVLIHGSDAARFSGLIAAGVVGFLHPPGGARNGTEPLLAGADSKTIALGITIGETEEAIRNGERSPEQITAYKATRSNVLALLNEGALPVYASDIPGAAPRETLPIVLRSLVDLGLTNAEVLYASTRHPAHAVLGRHDLGTLESGNVADIVIVDGNPLNDLEALQKVAVVIKGGKVVVDNR